MLPATGRIADQSAQQRVVQSGVWGRFRSEPAADQAAGLFLLESRRRTLPRDDETTRRDDVEAGSESGSEAADAFAEIGAADVGIIDRLDREQSDTANADVRALRECLVG